MYIFISIYPPFLVILTWHFACVLNLIINFFAIVFLSFAFVALFVVDTLDLSSAARRRTITSCMLG